MQLKPTVLVAYVTNIYNKNRPVFMQKKTLSISLDRMKYIHKKNITVAA